MANGARGSLTVLRQQIETCTHCDPHLPLGPRPIVQFSGTSSLVIVGQAPGAKVHGSGVPWQDPSGDHLRSWLGMSNAEFYDVRRVALVPMGFCYPGRASGGDAPPRPECAPKWHERIFEQLPASALVVLCGQYAQRHYLQQPLSIGVGATVQRFREFLPRWLPLPHPSWRSKLWMKANPWFEHDLLPELRSLVRQRLGA